MIKIKLISILILTVSLFFLGCVEEKPVATPIPTAIPTATSTVMPTVVQATPTPTPVPTQMRESKLYTSEVDDMIGFYKVISSNGSAPYDILNHTLLINTGDTVRWRSQTNNNFVLTIVSQEGLWDNSSSRLKAAMSFFEYKFEKAGEYGVYLDKFPKVKHQKIIVNP